MAKSDLVVAKSVKKTDFATTKDDFATVFVAKSDLQVAKSGKFADFAITKSDFATTKSDFASIKNDFAQNCVAKSLISRRSLFW